MTPKYIVPEVSIPEKFKESSQMWKVATVQYDLKHEKWWEDFKDPYLNELVRKVNNNNLQIAAAVARYDASRAFLSLSESANSPQVVGGGASNQNKQSDDRPLRSATQPNYFPTTTIGVQASYELDFWGRIRSQIKAASALSDASKQDVANARMLIEAEVMTNYFALRSLDSQLLIVENNIELYQKQSNIFQKRFEKGTIAGNDLYRSKVALESEMIKEKALKTKRAQLEHAIALLIAEPASNFSIPAGSINDIVAPDIAVDLPSTLLLRRPDILSAEKKVEAANELIGVARAAFYPDFSLTGIIGYQNSGNDSLISLPTQFWSIGPAMFFTIFDGGARNAGLKQAIARNEEATALYKNTVLSAIKDVEDVLVDTKNREASLKSIQQSVEYSNKNYLISMARYNAGISTYLEVVDSAIQKSQSELQFYEYKSQLLSDRVLLVKSLGGYWTEAN
jgi:NodT family efflux transporter outer membrane factor (OMF) lipoprotein